MPETGQRWAGGPGSCQGAGKVPGGGGALCLTAVPGTNRKWKDVMKQPTHSFRAKA